MKIIIPVAGFGTRLRPHTHTAPKALLYVAGKPLLGHILDSLMNLKFEEVTFVTGFMGEKIIDFVRANYTFKSRFVDQEELKGLGYAINLAIREGEKDQLLIILGDTIVEIRWADFINQNKNLLGVKPVDDPRRFGVAEVKGDQILRVWEKPEKPPSNLALVGVYYVKETPLFKSCLDEVILRGIKTKDEYQVTDAFQLMLEKGASMHTYMIDGWYDCGESDTLLETNRHLLSICGLPEFDLTGSVVIPPVFIDKTAEIERSIIGPYVSIAANTKVSNSIITNSIISYGATVINGSLADSLVGNSAQVKGTIHRLNVGDSSEIGY